MKDVRNRETMMWREPDMSLWQGREDGPHSKGHLRWHQQVTSYPWATLEKGRDAAESSPGICLLGFASDTGVHRNQGRVGARDGPAAVRKMLANCAYHLNKPLYDAGDVVCLNQKLALAQEEFAGRVQALLRAQQRPLLMGGGHEIAFGSFWGWLEHVKEFGDPQSMGIINFDAHFDLREQREASSGTPFLQMAQRMAACQLPFHYLCLGVSEAANTQALFETARSLGVQYCCDWQMRWPNWEQVKAKTLAFAAAYKHLYVTVDLDVFPCGLAPGVSAPAMGGVGVDMVESLLLALSQLKSDAASQVDLFEVAELSPNLDEAQKTTRLAARLVYLGSQLFGGQSFNSAAQST